MTKTIRFRRTASLTIAAIMAISAYMPVAAFADVEEGAPAQQPAAAEQQEAAPAPAPAQSTPAPAAQSAPAAAEQPSSEPASAGSTDQDIESETQQIEEPSYGEATGNWGYGNETKTTKWTEYTNGKDTILVFSTTGESDSDEENAVTQILDQDGKSQKDKLKNNPCTAKPDENACNGCGQNGGNGIPDLSKLRHRHIPSVTVRIKPNSSEHPVDG